MLTDFLITLHSIDAALWFALCVIINGLTLYLAGKCHAEAKGRS